MPKSPLRLVKHAVEYWEQEYCTWIPSDARGIYVLYERRGSNSNGYHYNVLYVGMARNSIRSRLRAHIKSKGDMWSHFSAFEVWDNISDEEIGELEGLFRHIYKFDAKANSMNLQKRYRKMDEVKRQTRIDWDFGKRK